ncbi:MAG: hypothetical protein HGB15_04940 [Chlorobaculum sp.]|jgi:hypothetical protein|nr:hypothetical protein [Chlorobaculum sp.]
MNRTNEQRNAEVTKTLEMLDKMPKIEVNHHFRARLLQRIDAMEVKQSSGAIVFGGAFSPKLALMTLLLVLNIASAVMMYMHQTPQLTGSSGAVAESMNEDYGGPALSYYDDQSAVNR